MAPPDTSTTAPATRTVVVGEAAGFSGTANFWGQLSVEQNPNLSHVRAYGQSGVAMWGEWEKIRRQDPAVAQAIDFVLGPIRDATRDVEAADETPLAQAQADFVRWCLMEALAPTFATLLDELARGSLATGFALHELVWDVCRHESLPRGAGYRVRALEQRLPSSLPTACWLEKNRQLRAVKQQGFDGEVWREVELPIEKLLLTSWQREGNNYAGYSQFRPVWYDCQIRDQLSRMVGIALTREGAGIPVAYCDNPQAALSKEERLKLEETLRNLVFHESAHMVMKPGWRIDWVFSPGANKGHIVQVINHFGQNILSVCHAQQMMLGLNETGNRAVGTVHDKRAEAFIKSVIANLLDAINGVSGRVGTGLVQKLCEANWGMQPEGLPFPKVTLTLQPTEVDPNTLTDSITKGITGGALTWRLEDENKLRTRLGLGPIAPEEYAEARAAKAAANAAAMAAAKKAEAEDEEESEDDELEPKPKEKPLPHAAVTARRALRPTELVLNLDRMTAYLDGAREEFERRAKPMLVAALAEVLPFVKEAMADGLPDEVAQLPLRLEAFDAFVRRFLTEAVAEGASEVAAELAKGGTQLRHASEDDDEGDETTRKLVNVASTALVRRVRQRLTQQMEDEAIDVVRLGGDATDVVTRVTTRALEGAQLRTDAGVMLTRAWNGGREYAARELGGVSQVELSAALDSATCMACNALDGTRFDFESEEHEAHVPPLKDCAGGPNCRCVLIYLPASGAGGDEGEEPEEREPEGQEPPSYPVNREVSVPVEGLDDLSPVAYNPDRAIPLIRSLLRGEDIRPDEQGVKISTDTEGFRFAVDGNHRTAVAQVMDAARLPVVFKDEEAARNDVPREKAPYDPSLLKTQRDNFEPVLRTGMHAGEVLEPAVLAVLRKLKRYSE